MNQQPISMRPLGQNNCQTPGSEGQKIVVNKAVKVTACADSTGVENEKNMTQTQSFKIVRQSIFFGYLAQWAHALSFVQYIDKWIRFGLLGGKGKCLRLKIRNCIE